MQYVFDRWTETELTSEITRLGELIDKASTNSDERSKCAVSYLQQVLRDRRDALSVLRKRRTTHIH